MAEWDLVTLSAKPGLPAREQRAATGMIRVPARPGLPERHRYHTTIERQTWDGVEGGLVDFWLKVCDVLPQYFPDDKPAPPWDRIVCIIDVVYGHITTQLRSGVARPVSSDRVTVMVEVPLMRERGERLSSEDNGAEKIPVLGAAREALRHAANREPANSNLRLLQNWHPFALFSMEPEDEESLRPLT
jgi:hypothetical protein